MGVNLPKVLEWAENSDFQNEKRLVFLQKIFLSTKNAPDNLVLCFEISFKN